MKYKILNENYKLTLIERLLEIRGVASDFEAFFEPTLSHTRIDPFRLDGMDVAVNYIIQAIKNNKKIMIFGDYDVDGITASYCLYKFFRYYLKHNNVSIMYPDRQKDGYGMRTYHLDEMKNRGVDLVITVDNGITSIEEAKYAKKIGLELIITDHHQPLDEIPQAIAVLNQNCSSYYPFKGLCGAGVAFKLIVALLSKSNFTPEKKNQIFNFFLPIVAIGTVADVVPLVGENRYIVKAGLQLMNRKSDSLPPCLKGFLSYLNIKTQIDTYHIGFMIGPRINAGGRIASPYDSLNVFLHEGDKQIEFLEKMDAINQERKKLQEDGLKIAEKMVDVEAPILIAKDSQFHEGVIGIIAGRLTEKYNKPSVVFKIDEEKGTASASLRGPDYFSVIDMLKCHCEILERFGGHQGAGGLTVSIEKLEDLCQQLTQYCDQKIDKSDLEKELVLDTKISPEDWNEENFKFIDKFAPFGEGNEEPLFLLENLQVQRTEKVGKTGGGHLKIYANRGNQLISLLYRGKGNSKEVIPSDISVIGKIKRDVFNGGYFLDLSAIIDDGKILDL